MSPRASLGPGSGMHLKAWALDATRRRSPAANGKQRMRVGLFKRRILLARRLSQRRYNQLFLVSIYKWLLRCCPQSCPRSRVATSFARQITPAVRRQHCGSPLRLRRNLRRSPLAPRDARVPAPCSAVSRSKVRQCVSLGLSPLPFKIPGSPPKRLRILSARRCVLPLTRAGHVDGRDSVTVAYPLPAEGPARGQKSASCWQRRTSIGRKSWVRSASCQRHGGSEQLNVGCERGRVRR